jgi:4-aminobutyrate aminotransferase-like enzyme
MKAIREQCDVMICDEVQTGFGRSGETFWAWEKWGYVPDIITCGKPIANGYPMGACIFKEEL